MSTKPKQQSGLTFVPAPFEPCTFHSVICIVEFVCFCVNSCWSLCVRRRCFSSSFLSTTTTTPSSPSSPSLVHALSLPRFPFLAAPPSATFWKVCLGSVKASFVCAPKGKYPGKKKARWQYIKKTRKAKKEGKENPHHTRQQNYIWGQIFSPVGRHPPSLFWDLVQYSSLFQIVKFWKEEFRLL